MTAREQRLRERIDVLTAERDQARAEAREQRRLAERWRNACWFARRSRDRWRAQYRGTAWARKMEWQRSRKKAAA